jgi:hypothetical protein
MHVCMFVCMYICVCVYVCGYMCVCVCVFIYTYVYKTHDTSVSCVLVLATPAMMRDGHVYPLNVCIYCEFRKIITYNR